MDETALAPLGDPLVMAADIVSAYVSNNSVPISVLPALIASVLAALAGLGQAQDAGGLEKATPAQIRKSITPDTLISFEDGKAYKTLRRHLNLRGLTPDAYREKHGLPSDYPMTSATYSATRSALAKTLGLGQQRRTYPAKAAVSSQAQAPAADAPAEAAPEKPKRAGRPRKGTEAAKA